MGQLPRSCQFTCLIIVLFEIVTCVVAAKEVETHQESVTGGGYPKDILYLDWDFFFTMAVHPIGYYEVLFCLQLCIM